MLKERSKRLLSYISEKSFGFNIPEVLIALLIIGITVAMVIPVNIRNSNEQEYRVGVRKAIAMLNYAISIEYAINGRKLNNFATPRDLTQNLFKRRLNVVKGPTEIRTNKGADIIAGCDETNIFTTSEGITFCVLEHTGNPSGANDDACNATSTKPCGTIYIDLNGLEKPNERTVSAKRPKDQYSLKTYASRVAGIDDEYHATEAVLFDETLKESASD